MIFLMSFVTVFRYEAMGEVCGVRYKPALKFLSAKKRTSYCPYYGKKIAKRLTPWPLLAAFWLVLPRHVCLTCTEGNALFIFILFNWQRHQNENKYKNMRSTELPFEYNKHKRALSPEGAVLPTQQNSTNNNKRKVTRSQKKSHNYKK